jgi:hypothetical protein
MMLWALMIVLVFAGCGRSGPPEAVPSQTPSAAETTESADPDPPPAPAPAPAAVTCGTAQQADSVEVLDVPYLSHGRFVIYTVEGPSGPNLSFAVCGEAEEALAFDTLPERLGAYGLTLDTEAARVAYATAALRVRSADQLSLLESSEALANALSAGERRRGAALRTTYAQLITPPTSSGDAPWTLVFWGLIRDLVHIEVVIAEDGGLIVTDTVREADLPVPMRI